MPLERIYVFNEQVKQGFFVMFNPEEYSLNKDNNYASQAIPGLQSPLLQFVHGNLRTLDMELFFDTFETKVDVRSETQKVVALLDINSDLHTPPVLRVTWGSLEFRCVLAKVSQKFIKFFPSGHPARAKLNVTFFHNRFTNQVEFVNNTALPQLGVPMSVAAATAFGATVNSADTRSLGAETELEFNFGHGFSAKAAYTYLGAVVQRSFSSDNLAPSFNPNFPTIPIGAFSPLVGNRPFRRAPHAGR